MKHRTCILVRPPRLFVALTFAAGLAALAAPPCRAEGTPFVYVGHGFGTGALVGAASGYLFARADGFDQETDWKPLAFGVGLGAIAGGGLGLGLGIADMERASPGRGGIVLRDTIYGAGFGALCGGIAGGLGAISSEDPEHVLLGASIGTLIGTVGGAVLGFYETAKPNRRAAASPAVAFSLMPVRSEADRMSWLPVVAGRF